MLNTEILEIKFSEHMSQFVLDETSHIYDNGVSIAVKTLQFVCKYLFLLDKSQEALSILY